MQVPDGLLVFFPSYVVLEKCIEFWKMPSTSNRTWTGTIWDRITHQKLAVVEPQVLCACKLIMLSVPSCLCMACEMGDLHLDPEAMCKTAFFGCEGNLNKAV